MGIAEIAAQQAVFQMQMATAVMKNTAESQKAVADMVAQAARSAPVSSTAGTRLDISV